MAGVDLDFEYVRAEDGPAYVQFTQELHQALADLGLRLTVAVAPKTVPDQPACSTKATTTRPWAQL